MRLRALGLAKYLSPSHELQLCRFVCQEEILYRERLMKAQ